MDRRLPKVLITGATGFIGGRLLARLMRDHYPCAAVMRVASDDRAIAGENVKVIRHSGSMAALISPIAEFAPDVFVHLAATGGAAHQPTDVRSLLEANIVFGSEVLEGAVQGGVRGIIATSTFWEHGGGRAEYEPNSLYAASKRAFNAIVEFYVRAKGIGAITLELSDVYGPNDHRNRLLDGLRAAQDSGVPIDLSPGEQLVDLIHVDDVVEAYIAAIERVLRTPSPNARYTVATGRQLSVQRTVALFESVTGKLVPVRWGARAYRPNEVMCPWPGERLPGWHARISLEEGILQLITTPPALREAN